MATFWERAAHSNVLMFSLYFDYLSLGSGASGSKLTMLLFHVSLKSKTYILQIHCYFCWKKVRIFCNAKDAHIFPTKKTSGFYNVVSIYLTN